jgi:hypothetical protein
MPRKIISIAGAPGWVAELISEDPTWEEFRRVTLAGWAVVEEDDGRREVVGLVLRPRTELEPPGRVTMADEVPGFAGYAFSGMKTRAA